MAYVSARYTKYEEKIRLRKPMYNVVISSWNENTKKSPRSSHLNIGLYWAFNKVLDFLSARTRRGPIHVPFLVFLLMWCCSTCSRPKWRRSLQRAAAAPQRGVENGLTFQPSKYIAPLWEERGCDRENYAEVKARAGRGCFWTQTHVERVNNTIWCRTCDSGKLKRRWII